MLSAYSNTQLLIGSIGSSVREIQKSGATPVLLANNMICMIAGLTEICGPKDTGLKEVKKTHKTQFLFRISNSTIKVNLHSCQLNIEKRSCNATCTSLHSVLNMWFKHIFSKSLTCAQSLSSCPFFRLQLLQTEKETFGLHVCISV